MSLIGRIFELALDGVEAVRDLVVAARDARRAKVRDALQGYASGRSGNDAANEAGHPRRPPEQKP